MKNFVIVIISLLALVACDSNPNEKSIKEIESLLVKVAQAEKGLAAFSPEKVLPYIDTINFDVKFIQQEFKDTMSLETGTMVSGYFRIIKSISKFEKTYKDQKTDINYSKKQLSNLKADLTTGVVDSNLLAMYLPTEAEAVDRLLESNISLKIWYESIEASFVSKRVPVDSLIEVVKAKEGY